MQAVVIEAVAPRRHQIAGMAQAVKQMLIQKCVAHPSAGEPAGSPTACSAATLTQGGAFLTAKLYPSIP